ncbi:hypothetical protein AVEN_237985-1 [Araneus ventricosus]|uniref:C2H2-type domain-containing protein n=1 Tax=Araneus ventricosus TaxID=182803 RepID=A0A4Y2G4N0_ARAVE|nr:hypothetical protein AVEN_237985-1 [Araneus ventricosus]
MDVSLGNENYFQDKFAATDKCHSPEVIDNEGKPKRFDIESFLTTVNDLNESSGKGTELNLPVTIMPCLDTLIENVVGELHKFDSINNLTISSNFIEDPSVVSSKGVPEHSLSNYAFSDFEKIGTIESSVQKIEKNCPNPEFEEAASCEVNVNRRADSSSAALFETDHTPSNHSLREKEEEKCEVHLNYKKIESEKLVDESNEMQSSYEVNNFEQEKKSLEFQNNNLTGNFVNTPFEQSNKTDDIVNAEAICDGQFNGSEDCEMQRSTDEQSDQSEVSGIMPSKDSVNSLEMDKNLLESNLNEISSMDLNNTVVNFELGEEEQVMESDKNESKAKENSNERYCNMKKNGEKSENQYGCEVLKGIENNVNLKEKYADVIKNSKDKCSFVDNKLHSSSDMKSCKVVLDRLKPHILKRFLHLSNLNPIQILQSDVRKDRNLNTYSKEKSQRKLNRNLIIKNVQGANKGKKLNCQGNARKVDIMEKHNSKSKKAGKHFSVEKNANIYTDNEEEMFNRCSNLIKCSTSTKPKKTVYGKLVGNSLLNEDDSNESFENEQENETMSSDKKNTIKELDEKLLNQQKSCEKRNFFERELTVERDLQCHSKSDGLFESELLNLKDGNSSVSKVTNSYSEFDKTRNSSFMLKPCKVVLERLNSETLKMHSLDVYSFSNLISQCDTVFCSDRGTMLLDSCLSSSPEKQEDEEIILKKIQNKSPFNRLKKMSHKKLNSKLRNDEVDLKSLKMVSSKINKGKEIVFELNKNISSHVLDSNLIKKQEDIQKKEFKGTSKRGSTYFQILKHAKRARKLNEVTVAKNNKKWMHKSSPSMKLNIKDNNLNEIPEKKRQKVKYNKKEIDDLKALYSIKECRIVLEKLDSHILESYLYKSKLNINQVSQVFQSYQYNIDSDINACIGSEIVHIDRDGNRTVKPQKHLLKKHDINKTREECVQSAKLKKERILKTNFSFDSKGKRKTGSTFIKINTSKPDNAIYHSGESETAEEPVLCSGDSQDNPYLNSVPQVNAIDNNWMELDQANRLIVEQILMKKCNVMLEQCDFAILEKYLGKDWSKNLPERVHKKSCNVDLMDFEDSLASNSTYSVFSDSEYGDVSESSYQMDPSSDFDDNHSIEHELEFCDKKEHKDLFCKSCKRKFKTYSSLLSHEKKTHKTYCFKCVLCKEVSKKRDSYINHMKRNHPEVEPYVCDYPKCEESFRNKKQLSDHQKSHQRYCCRFCKKRYAKKTLLQRHVSDCH